jgi:hypothetical protein
MPEVDEKAKSLQKKNAVLSTVLSVALVIAVFVAVDESDSTTAHT